MGEFFRGWRRKAGCFMLVMAGLLMAGCGVSGKQSLTFKRSTADMDSASAESYTVTRARADAARPKPILRCIQPDSVREGGQVNQLQCISGRQFMAIIRTDVVDEIVCWEVGSPNLKHIELTKEPGFVSQSTWLWGAAHKVVQIGQRNAGAYRILVHSIENGESRLLTEAFESYSPIGMSGDAGGNVFIISEVARLRIWDTRRRKHYVEVLMADGCAVDSDRTAFCVIDPKWRFRFAAVDTGKEEKQFAGRSWN